MEIAFDFVEDPGHGWLVVPKREIFNLGIEKKITAYSFQRKIGGIMYAYLEEDVDAGTFLDAFKKKHPDIKVSVHSQYVNRAPIRGYQRFTVE